MLSEPMAGGSTNLPTSTYTAWFVALYLRISKEDKRAGESISITNQRALLIDHVKNSHEFKDATVCEYVDDGISGTTTERKDYKRLMCDVENGKINCIIVKDLSRIGRDMLDVDELLMNYLVERNVRFISLGDKFDSFIHPLSVLELAIINLFNQDYIHDLVNKSNSSRYLRVLHGEFMGGKPAFGYRISNVDKNKVVIDEEAAGYVRLIFSLATEGRKLREIANILNAQAIPTPSIYKHKLYGNGRLPATDPDYHFWKESMVSVLLRNEQYTGKLISKRYNFSESNMQKSKVRVKDDWTIIPNAFEAIITENEFKAVRAILARPTDAVPVDHIFYAKVRCAVCGYTMTRERKLAPIFRCKTGLYTTHYNCPSQGILQADVERIVLESLKAYVATLIDREEYKLTALRKTNESKAELHNKIKAEQGALKLLEGSFTKVFTALANGTMTKEAFLSKKEVINATIARKKATIITHEATLEAFETGIPAIEKKLEGLYTLKDLQALDRPTVDLLIDRILVHGENHIEVTWKDMFN